MGVLAFPTISKDSTAASRDWRAEYFGLLNDVLDKMEGESAMEKLWDITRAMVENKSEMLGHLTLAFVKRKHGELMEQEYCDCSKCKKRLKFRGKHKREVETHLGRFSLLRPYFYCVDCHLGFYPLDEALGLSASAKQYDVEDLGAWLASELPYEMAEETYRRCTGEKLSGHHMHECTREIAADIEILDVCPTREEVEKKIAELREGRFRRPVAMLAIDGAHAPTRPEPSPRDSERGKGEWREIKGFRLYLLDKHEIVHLLSWHQIGTDEDVATALKTIKDAGLIPEDRIRLCVVADGAAWIWNRCKEIFPAAKQVLDYYHCAEYLHELGYAQYGKNTLRAQEWIEATITRLFHNQKGHVLAGIKRMNATSPEAQKQIDTTLQYLTKHKNRLDYGAAKRGGFHIGSGAIESANKFIGHVRLKRSGAWWYPSNANNILKLRCAKYNGTYDTIIERYRLRDQMKLYLRDGERPAGEDSD
ncbi:MAG: ISKra4 family transposase [Syntrophobacteraceae bacterium]